MDYTTWLETYEGACCSIDCLTDATTLNLDLPPIENLYCPHCGAQHFDINRWALKPHKTHLCLTCGEIFEGEIKGVSYPQISQEYLTNLIK